MKAHLLTLLILATAGMIPARIEGTPAPSPAGDWPHARGPLYDGVFPRRVPLPPWPASGPVTRWEQSLGQGFSGMVVAAGRIFTQHQNSSGQELLCLDLATGAVRWRVRYAYPWEMDGKYPGPYGTPTVAEGRVYFSDCYGTLACVRAADGAMLWRFDGVKRLNPAGVDFGYAATPLVIGGRLYAPAPAGGADASVFCLDAITGDLLWQSGNSHPSYASCSPLALGGQDFLLLPLRNGIALFDRASGAEVWKDEWTRGYDEHSIWPIYQDPFLFAPSAFRRGARVYRLALSTGRVQVEPVWEQRVMSNDVLASALHAGHLYGFDVQSQQSELRGRTRGTLKCVELATGNIRWTQTGIKHCSVTRVGDRLLLLEDEGDLVLVDPDPSGYRELARARLPQPGKIWAAPLLIGDLLLVRGAERMACYSLAAVPPSEKASPTRERKAARADPARSLTAAVRGWFERYRTDAFIAPSAAVLAEWYAYAVALLGIALGWEGARRNGMRHIDWTFVAAGLGLIGTGALTAGTGRFSLVAPLTLYALFCWSVPAVNDPRRLASADPRRLRSYLRLASFIAVCYGYYAACDRLFLVSGWGFLTGFPAVVLLVGLMPRIVRRGAAWRDHPAFLPAWRVAGFTVYYWISAVAIGWSAK